MAQRCRFRSSICRTVCKNFRGAIIPANARANPRLQRTLFHLALVGILGSFFRLAHTFLQLSFDLLRDTLYLLTPAAGCFTD